MDERVRLALMALANHRGHWNYKLDKRVCSFCFKSDIFRLFEAGVIQHDEECAVVIARQVLKEATHDEAIS